MSHNRLVRSSQEESLLMPRRADDLPWRGGQEEAEVGNQTLLRCLFPLLCVQSIQSRARLRRSDTLGGWLLARQAVGAGLFARDKATGKENLPPALDAKSPASPQLPWPAAWPHSPCSGSQAPSVGPGTENPLHFPREKHNKKSNCLHPACRLF